MTDPHDNSKDDRRNRRYQSAFSLKPASDDENGSSNLPSRLPVKHSSSLAVGMNSNNSSPVQTFTASKSGSGSALTKEFRDAIQLLRTPIAPGVNNRRTVEVETTVTKSDMDLETNESDVGDSNSSFNTSFPQLIRISSPKTRAKGMNPLRYNVVEDYEEEDDEEESEGNLKPEELKALLARIEQNSYLSSSEESTNLLADSPRIEDKNEKSFNELDDESMYIDLVDSSSEASTPVKRNQMSVHFTESSANLNATANAGASEALPYQVNSVTGSPFLSAEELRRRLEATREAFNRSLQANAQRKPLLSELQFDEFRLSPRPLSRSTSKLANVSTDFDSESEESQDEEFETRPLTLSSKLSSLSGSPKSLKQSIGELEETKMQFDAIKREAELLLQSESRPVKVSFTAKVANFLLTLFKASLVLFLFTILFFLGYCIRSPAAQPVLQEVITAETWNLSAILIKLFNPSDLTAHFAGYFGWFLNWLEEWKHIVPS